MGYITLCYLTLGEGCAEAHPLGTEGHNPPIGSPKVYEGEEPSKGEGLRVSMPLCWHNAHTKGREVQ